MSYNYMQNLKIREMAEKKFMIDNNKCKKKIKNQKLEYSGCQKKTEKFQLKI